MHRLFAVFSAISIFFMAPVAMAEMAPVAMAEQEQPEPSKTEDKVETTMTAPDPMQVPVLATLVAAGVKFYYLGRNHGVDGWLSYSRDEKENKDEVNLLYTTPDGKAMVLGVMFDDNGKSVTAEQIKQLKESGIELPFANRSADTTKPSPDASEQKVSTVEKLWQDFEKSIFLEHKYATGPIMYVAMDPDCTACKSYWAELQSHPFVQEKIIRLRIVPIGITTGQSKANAAAVLSSEEPYEQWSILASGMADAPSTYSKEAAMAVDLNNLLIKKWEIDQVPFTIYKNRAGRVMVFDGKPETIDIIMSDLTRRAN